MDHFVCMLSIKNWYLLLLISSVIDHVHSANILTKNDLHGAYNLEGDKLKQILDTVCYFE